MEESFTVSVIKKIRAIIAGDENFIDYQVAESIKILPPLVKNKMFVIMPDTQDFDSISPQGVDEVSFNIDFIIVHRTGVQNTPELQQEFLNTVEYVRKLFNKNRLHSRATSCHVGNVELDGLKDNQNTFQFGALLTLTVEIKGV